MSMYNDPGRLDRTIWERAAAILLAGVRRGRVGNVPAALQNARDMAPGWCPPPLRILYSCPPLGRMSWALSALGGRHDEIAEFLQAEPDLVVQAGDQAAAMLADGAPAALASLRALVFAGEHQAAARGRPFPPVAAAIVLVAGLLLLTAAAPLVTGPISVVSSNPPGGFNNLDSVVYGPGGAALLDLTALSSDVVSKTSEGGWSERPVHSVFQVSRYLGPTWTISWYGSPGTSMIPGPFVEEPAPLGWPIGPFVMSGGRLWLASPDEGSISVQSPHGRTHIHAIPGYIATFSLAAGTGGGARILFTGRGRVEEWLLNRDSKGWTLTRYQAPFTKTPLFMAAGSPNHVVLLAGRSLYSWDPGRGAPVRASAKLLVTPQYLEAFGHQAWVVGIGRAELVSDAGTMQALVNIAPPNAVGVLPNGNLWVESDAGVTVYVPR